MTENKLILLADDHVIIRRGMKVLMDNFFKREQIIEADSTQQILRALQEKPVTHMILDMQLQDANVIEILPQLRSLHPNIPVLIYTMSSEDLFGSRMLQMGATGFLSKQSDEQEVVKALDLFFRGRPYVSNHLQEIMSDSKQKNGNPLLSLSEREMSVLHRLLKGETVKEISNQLDLKATTVATYKARIFEKLSVSNIMDLRNVTELYQFKGN
jgi:two-component system, NarL family, invasion response regulator UvrY